MTISKSFWNGRRVFITGHTGFKGGWLTLLLHEAGAEVHGFALPPPTSPSMFEEACLEQVLASHTVQDINDFNALEAALRAASPELVLHLAAQPLVRASYDDPLGTYATNVIGTANVLEAVRRCSGVRGAVCITTDKCYENKEWLWGYRENEALGGHDPYSSSKACAELITAAYRKSFLAVNGVGIASARAGNVIGGGDWAMDRLLPDFFRAVDEAKALVVRSPAATRPWQHVLEPLTGYLALAELLLTDPQSYAEAWNFGPEDHDARPVSWVLDRIVAYEPSGAWTKTDQPQPHEAARLKLDSSKAKARLGWCPRWTLDKALEMTVSWHRAWRNGEDMRLFSIGQITEYIADTLEKRT